MENNHKQLIEALLYARGEEGLVPREMKVLFDLPTGDIRSILRDFASEWNADNRHGTQIIEYGDIFKMATKEEFYPPLVKILTLEKRRYLSDASLEVVGIVAYKGPISRGEISAIRGINSEQVVASLLAKGLIEEKGVAETPGRPILYGVSAKFFDYFRLKSLTDLPELSEINAVEDVNDDFELFQSQRETSEEI